MGDDNQRRHRRLPVHIPVVLTTAKSEEVLLTDDVSFSGIFVRTDHARPARQLVQVRLVLPTTQRELAVAAGVVHVIAQGSHARRICGMGLRFRALDVEARGLWDAFIHTCTSLFEADPDHGLDDLEWLGKLSKSEPVKRRFSRAPVELRIDLRTTDALHALVTRDVSQGGTFVRGDADHPPGTPVRLLVHHPRVAATLTLTGVIVRTVRRPPEERGLGIAFDELSADERRALTAFVREATGDRDSSVFIIEDEDLVPG